MYQSTVPYLVRMTGLEPARLCQRNLNPPSLPIPPHPHMNSRRLPSAVICSIRVEKRIKNSHPAPLILPNWTEHGQRDYSSTDCLDLSIIFMLLFRARHVQSTSWYGPSLQLKRKWHRQNWNFCDSISIVGVAFQGASKKLRYVLRSSIFYFW